MKKPWRVEHTCEECGQEITADEGDYCPDCWDEIDAAEDEG